MIGILAVGRSLVRVIRQMLAEPRTRGLVVLVAGLIAGGTVFYRWVEGLGQAGPERSELRVWDWWSASTNEEYGDYFAALERQFEERNPDVDVVFQTVPFGNYVQKLSTAMVGDTPPDVFQSSVYWAEGFHHRGMLRPLNDLLAADPTLPGAPGYVGERAFLPSPQDVLDAVGEMG